MARLRMVPMLAGAAALGLTLTACSTGNGNGSSSATGAKAATATPAKACPSPTGMQPPGKAPQGDAPGGDAPSIPTATSVAESDTSTSEVVTPDGPQIQCGATEVKTYSDITFSTPTTNGKKTELKLDVIVPRTAGKKPLVIYIPGGGFMTADKDGSPELRTYVAEQNYVVAGIQYRTTMNGATYKDGTADVKSAVRYLRAHADEYDIDIDKVALWGESAGGYLAAMAGTTNGVKEFETGDNLDQSSDVQAVIDKFGASDLSKLGDDFDAKAKEENMAPGNALALFVYGPGTKKSVEDYTAEVKAADPATYVDGDDPPFAFFHGDDDRLVSPSQTLLLHNKLQKSGVDSTRYVISGAGHGDLAFMGDSKAGLPWTTQKVAGDMVSFLDKHLGN